MILRLPYYSLLLAVFVSLGLFLLETFGAFQALDGVAYDTLTVVSPKGLAGTDFSSEFMILEGEPEAFYSSDFDWETALDKLMRSDARTIVFFDSPLEIKVRDRIQNLALASDRVWIGVQEEDWFGGGVHQFNSDFNQRDKVLMPELEGVAGVYRSYPARIRPVTGLEIETGPLKLARAEANIAGSIHAPDEFLISFIGRSQGLPKATLEEFVQSDFPLRLLQNRRVLVSIRPGSGAVGLYTPLSLTGVHLSPVEFHTYAWGTLMTGNQVTGQVWWLSLILITAPALLSGIFTPKLSSGASLWFGAMVPFLGALLCWASLVGLQYWPPFSGLVFSQILILGGIFHRRSVLQEESNQELLEETSSRMREKALPEEFLLSEERWTQIATTLSQALGWKRCAALEWGNPDSNTQLQTLAVAGCAKSQINLSSIETQLKDIQLGRGTLEEGVWAGQGIFNLESEENDLPQFLTPLYLGGDILGAWVFMESESRRSSKSASDWKSLERSLAVEMSELLEARYLWRRRLEDEKSRGSFWRTALYGDEVRSSYEEIQRSFTVLENRRMLLNQVFNSLDTAAILYDWFGNVVQINEAMTDQLKSWGVAPFQITALELLSQLTGKSQDEAREYFRIVMQRKETVSISVQLGDKSSPLFLLLMRPVSKTSSEGSMNSLGLPSSEGLMGILFELLDISRLKRLFRLKDLLFKHSNIRIRQDLETLVLGMDALNQPEVDQEERLEVAGLLEEKTMDMVSLSQSIDNYLDLDVFTRPLIYPAPANVPLKEAMEQAQSWMELRGLEFELMEPAMPQLVLADYDELTQLFGSIFKTLMEDATEKSRIRIEIQEEVGSSVFRFSNQGFGMPGAILKESLHGKSATDGSFEAIRMGIQQADSWGGELSCESEIGKGFVFTLVLKRV